MEKHHQMTWLAKQKRKEQKGAANMFEEKVLITDEKCQ